MDQTKPENYNLVERLRAAEKQTNVKNSKQQSCFLKAAANLKIKTRF